MKNLSFMLSVAMTVSLVTGCTTPTVQTENDRFTGDTINHTGGVFLPHYLGEDFQVVLNLAQKIPAHGKPQYFLVFRSISLTLDSDASGSHLTPNPLRTSLYVLAGDHRFSSSWSDNQAFRFWFPIQKADVMALGSADDIEIRVVRTDGTYWERKLTSGNVAAFHQCASRFLKDQSAAAAP